MDIGEYLQQPDHNFARGQSAQFNVAPELKGTMRRCDSCHDASEGHADWLPYIDKHMTAVACETCHIPQMYAPAIQSYDWTVLTIDNQPVKTYRGVEGDPNQVTSLVTGYKPVLLNRTNIDGKQLLTPYNLITSYYWVYDDAKGNKPYLPRRPDNVEALIVPTNNIEGLQGVPGNKTPSNATGTVNMQDYLKWLREHGYVFAGDYRHE